MHQWMAHSEAAAAEHKYLMGRGVLDNDDAPAGMKHGREPSGLNTQSANMQLNSMHSIKALFQLGSLGCAEQRRIDVQPGYLPIFCELLSSFAISVRPLGTVVDVIYAEVCLESCKCPSS
eukprot:1307078-Amphidinium_carterae.3